MLSNTRSVIIETIILYSGHWLSHKKVSRIAGISQCDISKVLRRVGDTTSVSQVLLWHQLKITTWQKDQVLFVSWREAAFSQRPDQGGADLGI